QTHHLHTPSTLNLYHRTYTPLFRSGAFKAIVFGITLAGCPLDEKISEMNLVKQEGNTVGALAIVTIDNPMAAGTGHRICNDCMKDRKSTRLNSSNQIISYAVFCLQK